MKPTELLMICIGSQSSFRKRKYDTRMQEAAEVCASSFLLFCLSVSSSTVPRAGLFLAVVHCDCGDIPRALSLSSGYTITYHWGMSRRDLELNVT